MCCPADDVVDVKEHSYAALAAPPSPALEVSVVSEENEDDSMQVNISCVESTVSQSKKAKFSAELNVSDASVSTSPDLPHKLPARMRSSQNQDSDSENSDDSHGEKTNLFGLNFVMWFEVGIEGKDPMDQDEEDWGGKIEFGFSDKHFPQEIEDYFLPFEDQCSLSHSCAGRVMGILEHVRDKVIKPPEYDPRNIIDLIEKYGDAHISDCGWRVVDREEWYLCSCEEP